MRTFPMFLKTTGRQIIVLGGGEQAAQKVRLALKSDAAIAVFAPELDPELDGLAAEGRVTHLVEMPGPGALSRATLVFVATGCPGADAALAAVARDAGALLNVVDAPDLCDAFTPSIVDRDPVVVAIGTEGTAPVLARMVKTRVEEMLEPRLGDLAALAGRLRRSVAQSVEPSKRRAFWRWVFTGPVRSTHGRGAEREAAQILKDAIAAGGAPGEDSRGFVSLVGAGPGSRDLITLRAIQRLQEADIIFYDRLVDPEVLEFARRDAERVYVGKTPGSPAWPQTKINGVIVAAARQGKRVVRLKCGDPGIFGRAAEEIGALEDADIGWEMVPGVTAASAAAAATGSLLTERDLTDTLTITTGQCRPGMPQPDWAGKLQPGTTLAVYMGVAQASRIRGSLAEAGLPRDLPVEVISRAATPDQQAFTVPIERLPEALSEAGITGTTMLLIKRPKGAEAVCAEPVMAVA